MSTTVLFPPRVVRLPMLRSPEQLSDYPIPLLQLDSYNGPSRTMHRRSPCELSCGIASYPYYLADIVVDDWLWVGVLSLFWAVPVVSSAVRSLATRLRDDRDRRQEKALLPYLGDFNFSAESAAIRQIKWHHLRVLGRCPHCGAHLLERRPLSRPTLYCSTSPNCRFTCDVEQWITSHARRTT